MSVWSVPALLSLSDTITRVYLRACTCTSWRSRPQQDLFAVQDSAVSHRRTARAAIRILIWLPMTSWSRNRPRAPDRRQEGDSQLLFWYLRWRRRGTDWRCFYFLVSFLYILRKKFRLLFFFNDSKVSNKCVAYCLLNVIVICNLSCLWTRRSLNMYSIIL